MALNGYHILLLASLTFSSSSAAGLTHCADIARTYTNMGYNSLDVPTSPVANSEDTLEVCGGGLSCCTRDMEMNIASHARRQYDLMFNKTTETARNALILITKDFNKLFVKILRDSQSNLDMKFTQTFGVMFSNNKPMFNTLYQNMADYMNGTEINLNEVFDKFASALFTKLFALRNGLDVTAHSDYLLCVDGKYKSLKPFGETIEKLKRNLRHSLVAARTLLQGLAIGRNTMILTAQIEPTASCSKANTRLSYCGQCVGLSSVTPCRDFCLNVMKGCLASHSELQSSWSSYADSLYSLTARFEDEDSFNLNKIASYLSNDISLSIIFFQANSELDDKVKGSDMCGELPKVVQKRSLSFGDGLIVRTKRQVKNFKNKEQLQSLVQILQENLRLTKSIWSDLPYLLCANVTNQAQQSGTGCWNGKSQDRYEHAEVGDGLIANIMNPEVKVEATRIDEKISEQRVKLQRIKVEMDKANEGLSSDWIDLQIPLSSEYLNSLNLKYQSVKSIDDEGGVFSQKVPTLPLKLLGSKDDEIGSGSGSGDGDDWSNKGWNGYKTNEDDEDSLDYSKFPGAHIIPIDPRQQHGPLRNKYTDQYSGSGSDTENLVTETTKPTDPTDEYNKNTIIMEIKSTTMKLETLKPSTPKNDIIPLATRTAVPKEITYSEIDTTRSKQTTQLSKFTTDTEKTTPKPANRGKDVTAITASMKTKPPIKSGRSQADNSASTTYPMSFLFLVTALLIFT